MTDFSVLVPDWPAPPGVRAMVTTRGFGNLADHVGDEKSAVAIRRAALRQHLPSEPSWLVQVHGTRCVDAVTVVPGTEADASFCRHPGVVCTILTADCLPVLFCDEAGTAVAAVHAGWRGLASGVLEATVAAMGAPADRLLAWLGPAIGPNAFEVGGEVRAAFVAFDPQASAAFRPSSGKDKWLCDLYLLARQRLARLGIRSVHGGGRCTFNETETFFSYRRERETGRMASLIWIV